MKVLLDSHTFLWMAAAPEKLSARATAICAGENLVLSIASVWEILIKCHIGKLDLPSPPGDYIAKQVRIGSISLLPIQFAHAVTAARLASSHKDPFDRMLAAQCIEESLPCLTRDPFFSASGIESIW